MQGILDVRLTFEFNIINSRTFSLVDVDVSRRKTLQNQASRMLTHLFGLAEVRSVSCYFGEVTGKCQTIVTDILVDVADGVPCGPVRRPTGILV